MLPVRKDFGTGTAASDCSPLQPNQMPPVSRKAARMPTASPPAVAALLPEIGVTRLETTTRRLTVRDSTGSNDILPCLAEFHSAVHQADQRIGLREVAPELLRRGVDVFRQ